MYRGSPHPASLPKYSKSYLDTHFDDSAQQHAIDEHQYTTSNSIPINGVGQQNIAAMPWNAQSLYKV